MCSEMMCRLRAERALSRQISARLSGDLMIVDEAGEWKEARRPTFEPLCPPCRWCDRSQEQL